MSKRQNPSRHDDLVRRAAHLLGVTDSPSEIRVDIDGYPTPVQLGSHVPDLQIETVWKRELFEVETCDSIFDDHTAEQWQDFYSAAQESTVFFTVVVPSECEGDAQNRLTELNMENVNIWGVDV